VASALTQDRAPYLAATLRPRAATLTNYHACGSSASLGQYMAMVSGRYTCCKALDGEPGQCSQSVPSLFAQLTRAGRP